MAKAETSIKYIAINKANTQMVIAVSIASFITVFSLVAAHSLWGQKSYQSRVTTAETQANTQLKANIQSVNALVSSYQGFVNTPNNVLGGSSTGSGSIDGDNATIVLDALPSKYDFPALIASLEKLLKAQNFNVTAISGTDDEVAQSASASSTPQPIAMSFSFTVSNANYTSVQALIATLEKSIRPIQIDTMTLSGGANDMQLTINAHTYYQPEKDLKVTTKVVK